MQVGRRSRVFEDERVGWQRGMDGVVCCGIQGMLCLCVLIEVGSGADGKGRGRRRKNPDKAEPPGRGSEITSEAPRLPRSGLFVELANHRARIGKNDQQSVEITRSIR